MKIIKKSKLINLVILFAMFLTTANIYPVDNKASKETQKTENTKQNEKNKKSKNNKQTQDQKQTSKSDPIDTILLYTIIILASTQLILPAIEIIGIMEDNISSLYNNCPLFTKKCNKKIGLKKVVMFSAATIGIISICYLLLEKNSKNNGGPLFKIHTKIKNTACSCKEFVKQKTITPIVNTCKKITKFLTRKNKYASLHEAILHGDKAKVEAMVNNGADVWKTDGYLRTPLAVAQMNHEYKIAEFLIENGAFSYSIYMGPSLTSKFSDLIGRCDIHSKPDRYKNFTRRSGCINDDLIEIILNKDTVPYEKQLALVYLIEECKNFNKQLDAKLINKLIRQIQFNSRFYNEDGFKEIREYAIKKNLIDCKNNSILISASKYSKDRDLVSMLIIKTYEKCSCSKNQAEKDKLKKEVEIATKNEKERGQNLY